jgi:hypothetical protein
MGDESAPAADNIDFGKKHPLEHTWTLWFDNPNGRQKLATFGKTLRPVYTFNTVEDFWWCAPLSLCPLWEGAPLRALRALLRRAPRAAAAQRAPRARAR